MRCSRDVTERWACMWRWSHFSRTVPARAGCELSSWPGADFKACTYISFFSFILGRLFFFFGLTIDYCIKITPKVSELKERTFVISASL